MALSRPSICSFLIDLSGTLHIGNEPTSNAVQALQRLRSSGIPLRFCSNTSKESTALLRNRLMSMGFTIKSTGDTEEIWTSLGAIKRRLEDKNFKKPLYLLSPSAREEIDPASEGNQSSDTPYDSVVVGLAPSLFTYEHLNIAFRVLVREHHSSRSSSVPSSCKSPALIATHKARYIRSTDGALSLGPGPFITALENASGVQAEVVGKPTRGFFETVIGSFGNEIEHGSGTNGTGRIAIIGDDVEADLGEGAVELGLWRILVKTGKYRPGDETRPGLRPPEEVHDSFASFVDSFLEAMTVAQK